jgi:proteasome assembly chaperone (PAC2) family protein
MSTRIDIVLKKKLKNPILIAGLPGIGLVGKIAVDYLVSELKAKPVLFAKVYSDSFPPAVHAKNLVLEIIHDEIHVYSSKVRDYLFLVGPVQPVLGNIPNSQEHYEFAREIASFAKKVGVKEIYTFAGLNIGDQRMKTKPKVACVATDSKTKLNFEKKKLSTIYFDKDNKDTLISGVAGLLPGIAYQAHKISGACLMGETDSKLITGDPASAKEILEITLKLFPDLNLNLKSIVDSAKKIEESFSKITKDIEKMNQPQKEEHQARNNYIR